MVNVSVCSHQRDSGDDEDMDKASEDEEGQLEEQIERLQEKVESAQSEQKNLFLVIFQVQTADSVTYCNKFQGETSRSVVKSKDLECHLVVVSIIALKPSSVKTDDTTLVI